ncbi:MAG TPA: polyhydroxyalkanoic acid system family protein [Allosphingosinicella sp.]|jgi:hypothetical protein
MSNPIRIDLPHKLGAEEARRRIAGGIGRLKDHMPGGNANVESRWEGNRLHLSVSAMAQQVQAILDVQEQVVHIEVTLPPALSFFGKAVEAVLRREGGRMLEDKSKP